MGRVATTSDGFGREVILGLLVEEESNCYQLDRRLSERFSSAEYTHGMASKTIKRLLSDGLVCAVDAGTRLGSGTVSRAGIITYEPTPAGVERFHQWMWASVATPPVREELHAKIALCQPRDMPRMIAHVREAETVCAGKLQDLNREVRSRRQDADPDHWSTRMDVVVSTGDQAWWESRIKWLQQVHSYLEEEWRNYQDDLPRRSAVQQLA